MACGYGCCVLDELALQVVDVSGCGGVLLRVFAALDVREAVRFERPDGLVIGLSGSDGFPHLWLGPLVDRGDRPVHLALTASAAAVDAVHAAAVEAAAEILRPPRLWPEYHPGYYGTFLRDPDGNNVEAVHHSLAGG